MACKPFTDALLIFASYSFRNVWLELDGGMQDLLHFRIKFKIRNKPFYLSLQYKIAI